MLKLTSENLRRADMLGAEIAALERVVGQGGEKIAWPLSAAFPRRQVSIGGVVLDIPDVVMRALINKRLDFCRTELASMGIELEILPLAPEFN